MVLWAREKFTLVDWARIDVIGLGYVARMPHIQTYMEMVTVLGEWWHSEMVSFHFPIGR